MLDTCSRSYYLKFLMPLLRSPWLHKIHPNMLTIIGCLFGIAICPFLIMNWTVLAVIALLLSGFFDALDGALARYLGLASPQGAALDIFCDRVVEFSILLGLYLVDPENRALTSMCMLA